jgi:hypothetical protein
MIVVDRLHYFRILHQLFSNDRQLFVWKTEISKKQNRQMSNQDIDRQYYLIYFFSRKIIIREAGKAVFSIYTEATRR